MDHLGATVWRIQIAIAQLRGQVGSRPLCPLWVDPHAIRTAIWRLELLESLGLSHQRLLLARVCGGEWDRTQFPIERLGVFEAIRQRFEEGVGWDEIPYFRDLRRSLEAGEVQFKYRGLEDLPRQWSRIEELYRRIEDAGVLTQEELGSPRPWDEIVVGVDRDGHLLFVNGRHRLAIARVLRCPRVPVLVGIRHAEWASFRRELEDYLCSTAGRGLRVPEHPDLAVYASQRSESRIDPLRRAFLGRRGRVVDLDCGIGYWCQHVATWTSDLVAVQPCERRRYFLERLANACSFSLDIVDRVRSDDSFEIALALDGFQSRSLADLERDLRNLRTTHLLLRVPEGSSGSVPDGEALIHLVGRCCMLSRVEDVDQEQRLVLLSRTDT